MRFQDKIRCYDKTMRFKTKIVCFKTEQHAFEKTKIMYFVNNETVSECLHDTLWFREGGGGASVADFFTRASVSYRTYPPPNRVQDFRNEKGFLFAIPRLQRD